MFKENNASKVARVFFLDPISQHQLRQLSRIIHLAPASVKMYLQELSKHGIILEEKHSIHGYPVYRANVEHEHFRFFKKIDTLLRLHESQLILHLVQTCLPDCVILFGSAARGEDLKESDIDLFLLCKEQNIDLRKFEHLIGRRINLFFAENFEGLSNELKNNIINGVIMHGYLKVF